MTGGETQGGNGRRRLQARLKRGVVIRPRPRPVGEEEQTDLAALGDAGARLDDGPAAIAVGCALHPPSRGVIAGPEPEHGQMHLALLRGHPSSPPARVSWTDIPFRRRCWARDYPPT